MMLVLRLRGVVRSFGRVASLLHVHHRADPLAGTQRLLESLHMHFGEMGIVDATQIGQDMVDAILESGQVRPLSNLFLYSRWQHVYKHRFKMNVRDTNTKHIFHLLPLAHPELKVLRLVALRESM